MNTFEIGSDPYCIISLVNPPKDAENLFKTEVVRKETKGTWKVNKEFGVSNASAILKFEVWVRRIRTINTNAVRRIGIA